MIPTKNFACFVKNSIDQSIIENNSRNVQNSVTAKIEEYFKTSEHIVGLTDDGNSALHIVTARRLDNCAALLLQKGADPFASNYRGESPLDIAVAAQNLPLIKLFLMKEKPITRSLNTLLAATSNMRRSIPISSVSQTITQIQIIKELVDFGFAFNCIKRYEELLTALRAIPKHNIHLSLLDTDAILQETQKLIPLLERSGRLFEERTLKAAKILAKNFR